MDSKITDILDNFTFTTIDEDFNYFYDFQGIPIANKNFYLNELFNSENYKIKNTNKFYQTSEFRNTLEKIDAPECYPWPNALDSEKKVILQMTLHPGRHHYGEMRTLFFDKILTDRVVDRLQKKTMYLFLYFGFEADSFSSNEFYEYGKYKNYYEMFDSIFTDYNLPKNSIIILSSNLSGEEQEKKYYNDKELNLATIFDNVYEAKTFTEIKGAVNLDYTFDEYIENVRKADYTILRTSRTQHYLRDIMLYWLINSNKIKNTLLEQNKFYDNSVFFDKLGDIRKLFYDNNYESKELFDLDENLVKSIKNELPFVASDYEKTNPVPSNRIYSNEVIPHDIYNKTIFSWVSTSIPDRFTQVFINSSTFNPILYYHPLIWNGNPYTIKNFKENGFKSYNFLFDESHDNIEWDLERLFLSIKDINRVLSLSKSDLIDTLIENKNVMIHNRELLFECNSITRIITKLHNYICE
jgi:hypothetical protein